MRSKGLRGFFEDFLSRNSFFKNKNVLQHSFQPQKIQHRSTQLKQLAQILAPCLKLEKPSNLFIYGKTGTGKTLSIKHISNELSSLAKEKNIPLKIIYLNCKLKKVADTEYRIIAQLAREFGKSIPPTGLPTDEIYKTFFDTLDSKKQIVLLILDEIDQLVLKTGDEVLYNLTRINSELKKSQISIIGLSNDLYFTHSLDSRVKSSLSEEEILFPPYNAIELQKILRSRCDLAFNDGVLVEGLIEKCAAYAARDHGDARRALDLLRVAAELAERNNETKVFITHLDQAENRIEQDKVIEITKTQPKQVKAVFYSIIKVTKNKKGMVFTGEVYELYKEVCKKTNLRPLTQRRVSDVLAELDSVGVINTKIISKGRYGRTREITLSTPPSISDLITKTVEDGLNLS